MVRERVEEPSTVALPGLSPPASAHQFGLTVVIEDSTKFMMLFVGRCDESRQAPGQRARSPLQPRVRPPSTMIVCPTM